MQIFRARDLFALTVLVISCLAISVAIAAQSPNDAFQCQAIVEGDSDGDGGILAHSMAAYLSVLDSNGLPQDTRDNGLHGLLHVASGSATSPILFLLI